jgi:hypothetical protein
MSEKKEEKLDLSTIIPGKIHTRFTNKIYPLNVALEKENVLISRRRQKHSQRIIKTGIKTPKNHICIWYRWPCGRNQTSNKNNGFRYKYLVLPRYLSLDDTTLTSLGLLEAEMETSVKNSCGTSFNNSEPELINHVIYFLKRFGIGEKELHWCITFNYKLLAQETPYISQLREKFSEEFWVRNTSISPQMKNRKFLIYTGNKMNPNFGTNTIKLGTLRIGYYDIIFRMIILQLLRTIKDILLNSKNEELIKNYMKGIFAGECDIKLTRSGSVDSVRIGCMNRNNKKFYRKCLKLIGVIPSKYEGNSINIHSQKNFIKIFDLGLVDIHPIRYVKFLSGLMKFKKFNNHELKKSFENIQVNIINKLEKTKFLLSGRTSKSREIDGIYNMVRPRRNEFKPVSGWKRIQFN